MQFITSLREISMSMLYQKTNHKTLIYVVTFTSTGIKNFPSKQLSTKTRENKIFHINLSVSGVSFKIDLKSVENNV